MVSDLVLQVVHLGLLCLGIKQACLNHFFFNEILFSNNPGGLYSKFYFIQIIQQLVKEQASEATHPTQRTDAFSQADKIKPSVLFITHYSCGAAGGKS